MKLPMKLKYEQLYLWTIWFVNILYDRLDIPSGRQFLQRTMSSSSSSGGTAGFPPTGTVKIIAASATPGPLIKPIGPHHLQKAGTNMIALYVLLASSCPYFKFQYRFISSSYIICYFCRYCWFKLPAGGASSGIQGTPRMIVVTAGRPTVSGRPTPTVSGHQSPTLFDRQLTTISGRPTPTVSGRPTPVGSQLTPLGAKKTPGKPSPSPLVRPAGDLLLYYLL